MALTGIPPPAGAHLLFESLWCVHILLETCKDGVLTNGPSSQRLALERRLPRLPRLEPLARRAADAPHHRPRRSTRHPSRSRDRCWRGERLWAGRGGDEAARGEGRDQARAVLDRAHRCAPFCLLDLLVLEKRVLRVNPSRAGCIAALWPVGARVVRNQHKSVQLGLAAVLGASSYSLPHSLLALDRATDSSCPSIACSRRRGRPHPHVRRAALCVLSSSRSRY